MDSLNTDLLNAFDKIIPSNINIVGITVKEVIQYLQKSYGNINEDIIFELRVILNELILNAVIHGNKADVGKNVKITSGLTKKKCAFVIVADDGEGYNYDYLLKKCKEPESMLCFNHLTENGRGILIVKSLCEQIEFNKKGNKVLVIKKLE